MPPKKLNKERVVFLLDHEQNKKLSAMIKDSNGHTSKGELIRRAIEAYLQGK